LVDCVGNVERHFVADRWHVVEVALVAFRQEATWLY
jgi:hypothetical protein